MKNNTRMQAYLFNLMGVFSCIPASYGAQSIVEGQSEEHIGAVNCKESTGLLNMRMLKHMEVI